ncbi:MAG: permease, partial [Caldilinea sp.]
MSQQVHESSNQQSIYAYIALGALLFVLFHAGGQTVSALLAGKDFQHAVPVIEKPVADLGKAVAAALTGWMPDTVISTPVGDFSVRTTVAYTIYEWVKLPILLFLTTFGMTLLRLKVGAQKIEKTLGRDDFLGAVSGTITGMLTPVCSCTVTNLYAGLVAGG